MENILEGYFGLVLGLRGTHDESHSDVILCYFRDITGTPGVGGKKCTPQCICLTVIYYQNGTYVFSSRIWDVYSVLLVTTGEAKGK